MDRHDDTLARASVAQLTSGRQIGVGSGSIGGGGAGLRSAPEALAMLGIRA